ncbi:hypothetical protein LSH36_212g00054 [Paralvinella palmiformis]|uniref:Phosphatidylinositol N-acetylglucosaminyltransferase subunit H conserved domain-containing protein n=1 Tax=Paralvinella palmiformis TaxID=53620 RepID=A0AAD9N4J3_9ANNE|nr:hypothetical protein LSH36_212g00054 [Paralvinella palmiformis]
MAIHKCWQLTNKDDVNKGSQQVHTQTGELITLTSIEYDPNLCKEYIVNYKRFSFKRWFIWMIIFNIVGYLLKLHTQDSQVMSMLLVFIIVALLLKINIRVQQESLLVSAGVGVQLTTRFVSGRIKSHFYDIAEVQDIIINEGITLHCWPRLDCLQEIYRDVQSVLHRKKQS